MHAHTVDVLDVNDGVWVTAICEPEGVDHVGYAKPKHFSPFKDVVFIIDSETNIDE